MKLIPDTNFLVYLSKYKLLDNLEDYDLFVLKQVIDELKRLSEDRQLKADDRKNCLIVLGFLDASRCSIEIIDDIDGKADDAILELAVKKKSLVGTMDRELVKRLKEKNIKILIIRQKKFLKII